MSSASTSSYIVANAQELGALPVDETFTAADVRENCPTISIQALVNNQIVTPVKHKDKERPTVWEFRPNARKLIKRHHTEENALPCGHRGFRNVENEAFECTACGEEYSRDVIRDYLDSL